MDRAADRAGILDTIRGQGRLTEDQINAAARELRMALLEADVALPVIKDFIDKVKVRALGEEITPDTSTQELRALGSRAGVSTDPGWSHGQIVLGMIERLLEENAVRPTLASSTAKPSAVRASFTSSATSSAVPVMVPTRIVMVSAI